MPRRTTLAPRRSSALPLALVYAALIVYASLYPFHGWRWPPGVQWHDLLRLPWLGAHGYFDEVSNLLGYMPLGLLLAVLAMRRGASLLVAFVLGAAVPAAASLLLEAAQHCVPGRVPSARDWALNALGAAIGAAVAVGLVASGVLARWERLRTRWFEPDSALALALLLLWPFGLLFPAPVPLGLGDVFDALQQGAFELVRASGWQEAAGALVPRTAPRQALGALAEGCCMALGLLGPILLSATVTRTRGRRIAMALGAAPVAVGAMVLSTTLNFGPQHAWAWLLPSAVPALLAATLIGVAVAAAGARLAGALALVCLAALVGLVSQAPSDPYYAASLQGWEQGEFVRFHGLARWIGWSWPYLAMGWLVVRMVGRR
ncbi:MAG: VanZ family protein [Rubrivivax sp.]